MSKYYVYALLDPRKPGKFKYGKYTFTHEPFYVGKGCGGRERRHFLWIKRLGYNHEALPKASATNPYKRNKIIKIHKETGLFPITTRLVEGLSDSKSLKLEAKAIKVIGRFGLGGPLTNMTDGGEHPTGNTGWHHTKESNRKNAESNKIATANRTEEEREAIQLKRKLRRDGQTVSEKKAVGKSNSYSASCLWNGSSDDIEKRNQNVSTQLRATYASMDTGRRLANTAIRALGSVLKKLTLDGEALIKFKELMIRRIRKYYSHTKYHKYPWSHVKLKVIDDYEKVLVGAIKLS